MLNENPDTALDYLYQVYYTPLCERVYSVTRDASASEDIVQEIFVDIWKNKDTFRVEGSLKSYLIKACRNRSLNHIRRSMAEFEQNSEKADSIYEKYDVTDVLIKEETEVSIHKIIDKLPSKCKIIFNLSRFEELTYNEIASQLGISSKTVENQISKALKILRDKLYKNQYDS